MRTQIRQPNKQELRVVQNKAKAVNQASLSTVLQQYCTVQRESVDEDESILQGKFDNVVRRQEALSPVPNQTGLPNNLKSSIETMSGYSMDDVRVHYNSSKPAHLQALAYTQGTDIHVASGQEEHLPHEAWHVVQQKQGRVQPTMQLKGVNVNDNEELEREADAMGERSLSNVSAIQFIKTQRRRPIKRRSITDADGDYIPSGERNKYRFTFSRKIRRLVLNKAPIDALGRRRCPVCKRYLTNRFGIELKIPYTSKSGKKHRRVTADLDHIIPWYKKLPSLTGKTAEQIKQEYSNIDNLRPLCWKCNQNHNHENKKIDNPTDLDDGYNTDTEERKEMYEKLNNEK